MNQRDFFGAGSGLPLRRTPDTEQMYWPILSEAKAYPGHGGTFSVDAVNRAADEMLDVWEDHDPFSLMNEPYRSMEA